MSVRDDLIDELAQATTTAAVERALTAYRWSVAPIQPTGAMVHAGKHSACWDMGPVTEGDTDDGEAYVEPCPIRFVPEKMYEAMVAAAKADAG